MIQEFQIRVLPEQAANEQSLKQFIGHDKGLDIRTIHALRILKRSIDARQRTIYVNLKVRLYINEMPQDEEFTRTIYNKVDGKPQVIVVGAGPGGLFAALRLIELGLRPVVVERGKNVRDRKIDIARISVSTKLPLKATTVSEKEEQEPIQTANSIPKQKARECEQNSECILPTWRQYLHPGRCPSPHRYRQVAACD